MSAFTSFTSISPLPDGRWITTTEMPFDLVYGDLNTRIVVPSGFRTDGATVPVLARAFIDRGDSRIVRAAILHDWMLKSKVPIYSAKDSSDAFYSALVAASIPDWKARLMFVSVYFYISIQQMIKGS